MTNVKEISPRNNLDNIPHMLRNLAVEFERDGAPRTLFLIALNDGNEPPTLYQFGKEGSRLEEAGAFASCMNMVLQTEVAS